MGAIFSEGLFYSKFLALHMFRMMYWVWIPGFFLSAFVTLRYRRPLLERLQQYKRPNMPGVLLATAAGITGSPNRKPSLSAFTTLSAQGTPPALAWAYHLASTNLVLYVLVVVTLLLGFEFAIGQVIASLLLIGFVTASLTYLLPVPAGDKIRTRAQGFVSPAASLTGDYPETSWKTLVLSGHGWWVAIGSIGREFRGFWLALSLGILLGGEILAFGLQSWWPGLDAPEGGVLTDLVSAVVAPVLAVVSVVPSLGNLPVASNLFKSYTLTYPGLVACILAATLKPAFLRFYLRLYGRRGGAVLILTLFVSIVLSALLTAWFFDVVGLRPSHVPMGREWVDAFIKWLPFTMKKMGGM
jgi:hypothetical protein